MGQPVISIDAKKKELIGIETAYPKKALADIVWGQIKRVRDKISRQFDKR